jgi:hypothetical protein
MKRDKFLHKRLADEALLIDTKFKENLRNKLITSKGNIMAKNNQLNFKQLLNQKSFAYAGGFALLLLVATTLYAFDNRNSSLARQTQ